MATESPLPRPRTALFVVTQLLLIGAAAVWAGVRVQHWQRAESLPPVRSTPRVIAPLYDYDVVVSDHDLQEILAKVRLVDQGADTRVNQVDHCMRYWGAAAEFDEPQYFSGQAMRELMTDHRLFVARYGTETPPLLIDAEQGVRVRVEAHVAASSHVDHTLACLAEVGTPLDFPLVTPTRTTTYRAMLEQSLRDFSLNQTEYEWSVLAYALYLEPNAGWTTSEGQQITFDMLARRLMREPLSRGVCFANHRMYSLAVLLRVDEQEQLLSGEVREEVLDYLRGITATLVQHQHPTYGYWNGNWPFAAPREGDEFDTLSDRILATGHALEWWAIAPAELHPPRPVLAAAGQWLVRTIESLDTAGVEQNLTFLSHACRALTLWRGHEPAALFSSR